MAFKIFVALFCAFNLALAKDSSRVIGGRQARLGQIPHQVAIITDTSMLCGGSILSTTVVVTAAHCTYGLPPTGLQVIAGIINLNGGLGDAIRSKNHIVHEKYRASANDYDVSIVILSKPLKFSNNIKPIALPNANDPLPDNSAAMVSGFGATDLALNTSPDLLYVNVPVQSTSTCNRYFSMTDRSICAGVASGQESSCQGDSGGPLTYSGKLYGIVSYGRGCGLAAPAVYVNVRNLVSWIKTKAGL